MQRLFETCIRLSFPRILKFVSYTQSIMRYISTLIITILGFTSFAQSNETLCFRETFDPKELKKQIEYYHKEIAKNSKNDIAYSGLGMCCYRLHKIKEAIAFYDTLILIKPKFNGAYSNRGVCKYIIKDKVGACEDFRLSVANGQNPKAIDGQTLSEYIKTKCEH
jgi:tetratricopeptide (TPR) repeat protein